MSEDLIPHIYDESGAHARAEERTRSRVAGILILTAMVAGLLVASGCASTTNRGEPRSAFGLRAAVDVGPPASQDKAPGATAGAWAAHQVRVVILARGDAGWPTAVQGATVRAFDPSTATLHEAITGPDGAVSFQSRWPLEMWVKLSDEDRPEVITWAPRPADDVSNQASIVHVLGGGQ